MIARKLYRGDDSAEYVAEKILEAIQSEEAEVYADSVKRAIS